MFVDNANDRRNNFGARDVPRAPIPRERKPLTEHFKNIYIALWYAILTATTLERNNYSLLRKVTVDGDLPDLTPRGFLRHSILKSYLLDRCPGIIRPQISDVRTCLTGELITSDCLRIISYAHSSPLRTQL